jgi:hypothetical protein
MTAPLVSLPLVRFLTTSVILASSICALAQSPDDRVPRDIVDNVMSNEEIYGQLEFTAHKDIKSISPTVTMKNHIIKSTDTFIMVYQDDLIYLRGTGFSDTYGGVRGNNDTTLGYNGKETTLVDGGVANIREGRCDYPLLLRPHTILLSRARLECPLSIYLKGGETLRSHPNAGVYSKLDIKVIYLGREKIDGVDCFKIKSYQNSSMGPTKSVSRLIWLAIKQNCLPVRTEAYNPVINSELPLEVGKVRGLKEVESGIWLPEEVVIEIYDTRKLKQGTMVVNNMETYRITNVNTHPNHPRSFFEVKIPDGMPVYVVRDGNIVKSYWQGGVPNNRLQPRANSLHRIILVLGSFALIPIAFLLRRLFSRFMSRASRSPPTN